MKKRNWIISGALLLCSILLMTATRKEDENLLTAKSWWREALRESEHDCVTFQLEGMAAFLKEAVARPEDIGTSRKEVLETLYRGFENAVLNLWTKVLEKRNRRSVSAEISAMDKIQWTCMEMVGKLGLWDALYQSNGDDWTTLKPEEMLEDYFSFEEIGISYRALQESEYMGHLAEVRFKAENLKYRYELKYQDLHDIAWNLKQAGLIPEDAELKNAYPTLEAIGLSSAEVAEVMSRSLPPFRRRANSMVDGLFYCRESGKPVPENLQRLEDHYPTHLSWEQLEVSREEFTAITGFELREETQLIPYPWAMVYFEKTGALLPRELRENRESYERSFTPQGSDEAERSR